MGKGLAQSRQDRIANSLMNEAIPIPNAQAADPGMKKMVTQRQLKCRASTREALMSGYAPEDGRYRGHMRCHDEDY